MSNTEKSFDQRIDSLLRRLSIANEKSNQMLLSAYMLSREVIYTTQEVNKIIKRIEELDYE